MVVFGDTRVEETLKESGTRWILTERGDGIERLRHQQKRGCLKCGNPDLHFIYKRKVVFIPVITVIVDRSSYGSLK